MEDGRQLQEEIGLVNFITALSSRLSHKILILCLGVGAFLLTAIGFFIFDLGTSISFIKGNVVLIIIFIFILIIAFVQIIYNFYEENIRIEKERENLERKLTRIATFPKVRRCEPPSISPNSAAKGVLILDPSEMFHQDDLVSIYYKQGEIETQIGYGDVQNIQENNKLIQVEILYLSEESILNGLLINNIDCLTNVDVRPRISKKRFEEYKFKEEGRNGRVRN